MAHVASEFQVIWKITWEYVSSRKHPQCYDEEGQPVIGKKNVPTEFWEACEVVHTSPIDAAYQYNGVFKMTEGGRELVRSVQLYQAVVPLPRWEELFAVTQIEPVYEAGPAPGGLAP